MASNPPKAVLVSGVTTAVLFAAAAPAAAATDSPQVAGSSAIGPQEILDWLIAFTLSALGVV